MTTFAEELNALRKERHITQEQLAKEMNVSRTAISNWENGKALPDIDTIKRLSQVMHYNFFTVADLDTKGNTTETSSEVTDTISEVYAEEASATQKIPTAHNDRKRWLYVAGGACLILLCVFLLTWIIPKTSNENQFKDQQAKLVVTPTTKVAYLAPFGDDGGYGWNVDFTFANESDVPFTPEKIVASYYSGDELRIEIPVPYEQLRPWMGNDKLLQGDAPLNWPVGANWLELTHVTVAIYGVDDNGNRIEASETVQYSQEYADSVTVQ